MIFMTGKFTFIFTQHVIAEKNPSERGQNERIKKVTEYKTLKNSSSKCHTTKNTSKSK